MWLKYYLKDLYFNRWMKKEFGITPRTLKDEPWKFIENLVNKVHDLKIESSYNLAYLGSIVSISWLYKDKWSQICFMIQHVNISGKKTPANLYVKFLNDLIKLYKKPVCGSK